MATTTAASQTLEPWDHLNLYNWLMSLAYHGLGEKRKKNKDLLGSETCSKDTEVRFDPSWTELPSLERVNPAFLRLVAWGSDKVVAVDSKFEESQHSVSITVFCLDLNKVDKGWVTAASVFCVKDDPDWQRPQCAIIGDRLHVIHPQRTSMFDAYNAHNVKFVAHSVRLMIPSTEQTHQRNIESWTTSESEAMYSDQIMHAATCVQGHQIVFVLKRWNITDIFDKAVVFDTVSEQWSTLAAGTKAVSPKETNDNGQDIIDSGMTVFIGAGGMLVSPHYAESHGCCYAISLAAKDRCLVIADDLESQDELMHKDDQNSGDIPWVEECGRMNDFGAFSSGSSLYTLPHCMFRDDDPCCFVGHDFSTRSCHYDEDSDRVWFRSISDVYVPEPVFPLIPSGLIKVGKWLVLSAGHQTPIPADVPTQFRVNFQAIAVHDQQQQSTTTSRSKIGGKSNFVHLGIEYYDKCIDTFWDEPRDENGFPQTQINIEDPRRFISFLLSLDPMVAFETNEDGKLPFQLALENPAVDGRMVRTILRANPQPLVAALNLLPQSLFPHVVVSLQRPDGRREYARELDSANDIYSILRQQPELVDRGPTTTCGGGRMGKRKRE